MTDTPVTEFVDLDIDRVDGVLTPANGAPFLVLKHLAPGASTTEDPEGGKLAAVSSEPTTGSSAVKSDTATDAPAVKAEGDPDAIMEGDEMEGDEPVAVVLEPGQVIVDAPSEPGSPEWEAMDAAMLTEVAATLARMAHALDKAKERELEELAVGAESSYSDVWSLEDAACALDFVLGVVARLAVTEAAEAEMGDGVAKAGKVLSAANETKIKNARDALTEVLGDAPDPEDNVDKALVEKIVDERMAARAAEAVTKSEGDEPTEGAAAPAAAENEAAAPAAAPEAGTPASPASPEGAGAADAPAATDAEEHPAEGDGVTKSTEDTGSLESMLTDVVSKAMAPLVDRIASLEGQPAAGGPFLATEGRATLPQNVEDVTKALMQETDPARRDRLAQQIGQATLAEFYRGGQAPQV